MSAIWRGLYELLLSAVPDASVNMLHDEAGSANPLALELRPRARTLDTLPVLPAKWTVIVFEVRTAVLSVAVVKMDRQVLDQREFEASRTMEVAEYIKSHPILSSKWSFCHGMRYDSLLKEQNFPDHFGGKLIRRSAKCELLVAGNKENDPGNECKFCALGDIDVMDGVDQVVKVEPDLTDFHDETEVCTEVNFDSDTGQLESISFGESIGVFGVSRVDEPLPCITQLPINCWGKDKPPLTYTALIALVLQYLPNNCGTLKDMYRKIEDNFPYYSESGNKTRWQNSVRHTLSVRPEFVRAGGHNWTFAPGANKDSLVHVKGSEEHILPILPMINPTQMPTMLPPLDQEPSKKNLESPQPLDKEPSVIQKVQKSLKNGDLEYQEDDGKDRKTTGESIGVFEVSLIDEPLPSMPLEPINPWGEDKPPLTYTALIALVLRYLPNNCGTIKDIYRKIQDNFPYYSDSGNRPGWKNSIRQTLTVHPEFVRAGGRNWTFAPGLDKDSLEKIKGSEAHIQQILRLIQPTPMPANLELLNQEPSIIQKFQKSLLNGDLKYEEYNGNEDKTKEDCQRLLKGEEIQSHNLEKSAVPETVSNGVSENKRLQCNFCDESFTVVGLWAKHMQQHSGDSRKERPKTKTHIEEGGEVTLKNRAKFKCKDLSGMAVKSKEEVKCNKFKCKYCGEEFESRKLLLSHKLSSHKDNTRNSFLAFYMDKVSLDCNNSQFMQCQLCDKVFIHVGQWVKHMQRHTGLDSVLVPSLQDYEVSYKEYTNAQKRSYHQNVGKYKVGKFICHLCGAVMAPSSQYYHLRSVHKMGTEEYKCEVCGKVDLCKYKHLNHLKTHSNERPFVCPHCGKMYKSKHGLNICVRRCSGLGLFECSTCSRKFTAKARLIFHERLHQGIRPYECPVCHLTYVRRTNLTDHVKRVHKRKLVDIHAEAKAKNENAEQN